MIQDMMTFLGKDWLLRGDTPEDLLAREFYEQIRGVRQQLGILDVHTHFSARQIYENEPLPNLTAAMLINHDLRWSNRDHYLIQALTGAGLRIDEIADKNADPKALWLKAAKAFPMLDGNHSYLWSHLALLNMGIDTKINEESGQAIYEASGEYLSRTKPQRFLRQANVMLLCTTDDPLDPLEYHQKIKGQKCGVEVRPTFRPDALMHIFSGENGKVWRQYLERFFAETKQPSTLEGLLAGMQARHDFFYQNGCIASDSGLPEPYGLEVYGVEAERIFNEAYHGKQHKSMESQDAKRWMSFLMHALAAMNQQRGWPMHIHFGVARNVNPHVAGYGPDFGGDAMLDNVEIAANVAPLLGNYASGKGMRDIPVILYPLNPAQYDSVSAIIRTAGNAKWGVAWWQNDTTHHMMDMFSRLGETNTFAKYAGMHCDGRSFLTLSPRFDTHDRCMARVLAKRVAQGTMDYSNVMQNIIHAVTFGNQNRMYAHRG